MTQSAVSHQIKALEGFTGVTLLDRQGNSFTLTAAGLRMLSSLSGGFALIADAVGSLDTPDVDLYIGVSSMYLLIAQQMGLLGVAAFAITIIVLYLSALQARKRIWQEETMSAIWLGVLGR